MELSKANVDVDGRCFVLLPSLPSYLPHLLLELAPQPIRPSVDIIMSPK